MSEETAGAGVVLGGRAVVRLAKGELMDGGGGRPGLDLNGGGRSGRSFILAGLERKINVSAQIRATAIYQKEETVNQRSYRGGRGGSEGLDPLVDFGLVWLSQVFLRGGDRGF